MKGSGFFCREKAAFPYKWKVEKSVEKLKKGVDNRELV